LRGVLWFARLPSLLGGRLKTGRVWVSTEALTESKAESVATSG
jgi:hypothetical protein